jgi:hypothetical protein
MPTNRPDVTLPRLFVPSLLQPHCPTTEAMVAMGHSSATPVITLLSLQCHQFSALALPESTNICNHHTYLPCTTAASQRGLHHTPCTATIKVQISCAARSHCHIACHPSTKSCMPAIATPAAPPRCQIVYLHQECINTAQAFPRHPTMPLNRNATLLLSVMHVSRTTLLKHPSTTL